MGKGDKPRNCFSKSYRDNYDDIDWGKGVDRDHVNDCPTPYRWGIETPDDWDESAEIFKGMVRQSNETPLDSPNNCGCDDTENCCANE